MCFVRVFMCTVCAVCTLCALCWLLWNLHTETIYIIYFLLFEYVRDMRLFNVGILVQACVCVCGYALPHSPPFPLNSHCFLFFIRGGGVLFLFITSCFFLQLSCVCVCERTECGLNYFNISMMVLLFPLSAVLWIDGEITSATVVCTIWHYEWAERTESVWHRKI